MTTNGALFGVLEGLLAVLFATLCYTRTATFRRQVGRNPWGIPPGVWLFVGGLFLLVGACLAFLACATTRVGPAYGAYSARPRGSFGPGPGGWSGPARVPERPPAGWYPDPSGLHQYRFFTGHDWTADVVDDGAHSTEPLPAPPGA